VKHHGGPEPGGRELLVRVLHVGAMEACCYLAGEKNGEGIVIDPGDEADRIAEAAKLMGLAVKYIICTHGHADHIAGLEKLRAGLPDAKVAIHADDAEMLERPSLNLSLFLGGSIKCKPAGLLLHDGDTFDVAGLQMKVIHVPGHTPGGICLHFPAANVLFSGDVLFAGGIGRTDFPGGNTDLLLAGIAEKLLVLPPQTAVYPGHGPGTTIGAEKETNPFLS